MDTSYFGNIKNVETPVSICGKAPTWYDGPQFKALAPKYDFFRAYKNGEIDEVGYTEQFERRVLMSLDPVWVYRYLLNVHGERVSLMCYEKPGEFCHRRIVAKWLEIGNGIVIPERQYNEADQSSTRLIGEA